MMKNIITALLMALFMHGCATTNTMLSSGQNSVTFSASDTLSTAKLESEAGVYSGDVKNGLPNGKGTYKWRNGEYYSGDYINGQKHGNGVFIWRDSATYRGQFSKGKRSGIGAQSLKNNYLLKGSFSEGYCSDCSYTLNKLKFKKPIVGEFALNGGKIIPKNVLISYNDGSIYQGEVNSEYLPHGIGSKTIENNKFMLSGVWVEGSIRETTSKQYTKEYLAKISREQKCNLKDESWIYTGSSCSKGLATGNGKAVSSDGMKSFEGSFKDGFLVKGTVIYKNQKIIGEWSNSVLSKAQVYEDNILVYDGSYANGNKHGNAMCFFKGEPEECKYYHGKRVDATYKNRLESESNLLAQKNSNNPTASSAKNSITLGANKAPPTFSEWVESCATGAAAYVACDKAGGLMSNLGGFGSLLGSGAAHMCKKEVIENNMCMKDIPVEWLERVARLL